MESRFDAEVERRLDRHGPKRDRHCDVSTPRSRILQVVIDTKGPLTTRLPRTLSDIGDAARSVDDLADFLERNPNAIVFGRPGP